MNVSQLKELVRKVVKEESDYQEMFKVMLDKTGKSIPDMSDSEKKAFFNAVDKAATAKNEGKLRGYKEGNAFGAAVTDAKEKGEDEFKVGGETFKVEGVNEDTSVEAYKISRMIGSAQQTTQDFIDDNKIDVKKLELYIRNLSIDKKYIIRDIINGSMDKRLTNIKKMFIKQVKESVNEDVNFRDGKYRFYSKDGIGYLTYDGKEIADGDYDYDGGNAYFMNHSSFKRGQTAFNTGKDVITYFKKNNITSESVNEAGPGLWANIRAKKDRGEPSANKGSQAHKDAVAAGNRISKQESVKKKV